jgi:hypothetical protein
MTTTKELTPPELAKIAGVARSCIYKWMSRGLILFAKNREVVKLPFRQVAGRKKILLSDYEKFLRTIDKGA